MQNYIQTGHFLTLPAAPYDLTPGDGALVGSIFGVSANESASGAECVLGVVGVYELPKVSTDAFAVGDPVYWDDGDQVCTSDDDTGSNPRIGAAIAAAGNPSSTVNVRLHGSW